MRKITVKLKTGTSQQEAEMLINASGNAFPEADIDVIYSDDPALSVVLNSSAPVNNSRAIDSNSAQEAASVNPYERLGWEYGRD